MEEVKFKSTEVIGKPERDWDWSLAPIYMSNWIINSGGCRINFLGSSWLSKAPIGKYKQVLTLSY